jgi:lipopolysaccharide biosynthesis protein
MFSIFNVSGVEGVQSHDVLTRDWTFVPSKPWHGTFAHRLRATIAGRRPPPEQAILKRPNGRSRWVLYFAFLPQGKVTPAHLFTLERLARMDAGLFVVCALPPNTDVPTAIYDYADAVASKGLSGFDFSAYAIGLRSIVEESPGCDLFVMNDSVFGPFVDLDNEFAAARWDFTGYTAYSLIENHIQSYAFIIKNVNDRVEKALSPVFPENYTYDRYKDVVFQQETRLARIASYHMSVGAKWFSDHRRTSEPSFFSAISLINSGFPFLKKSLLHRRPDIYDHEAIQHVLEELGHPRG